MKIVLVASLLVSLGAAAAFAQAPEAQSPYMAPPAAGAPAANRPPTPAMMAARRAMRQACAADLQRVCADAQAEGQRPMQCMRQHMSDLSPGCIQAIQAVRGARPAAGGPQS